MSNQKIQKEEKKGVSPMVAAVTGAVVGAGIAVAGTVVLKDEKNRNKVKEALTSAKDQAIDHMDVMHNQVQDKTNEAGKKLDNGLKEVKKAKGSAKSQLHNSQAM